MEEAGVFGQSLGRDVEKTNGVGSHFTPCLELSRQTMTPDPFSFSQFQLTSVGPRPSGEVARQQASARSGYNR